jgi:endonuclease/exonuclease/phosphatase (EEP) superfamily protein YafD
MSSISTASTIYAISILIWFGARSLLGDANWWLTLLNRFALFLFVPIPVLVALCLYTRRYKGAAVLLLPALIFGGLYHPYLFPRAAIPVEDGTEFRVMTFNVLYSNSEFDAVARVIKTHRPDLVALQEVQPAMMEELERRLADEYPFTVMGTEDDYGTTAVFSRHPILGSQILDLKDGRPAVVTEIRFGDKDITFASLHLLAYNLWRTPWKELPSDIAQRTFARERQVEILLEQLDRPNDILVVGCDCNSYETSGSYKILDRSLDNAARQVGWLLGSGNLPGTKQDTDLMHIDYVWYRGPVMPVRVYKPSQDGGSDHFPVLAIFHLQ